MTTRIIAFCAVLFCGILFLLPTSVQAGSSDVFTVTQAVNTFDVTPPTIPGNLTSTPISTSQIDLDWDASSDNISVDGYQVFRDMVQIATTTQTSYSDTGLSASTTYEYYVTAFDVNLNISTSSATTSTTTLAVPETPPTSVTSTSTQATRLGEIDLLNFEYTTTPHSITIDFETNFYTRATYRWGRTNNFESGFISSDVFRKLHNTTINDLEPGTVYEIELYLIDNRLKRELTKTITIRTDDGPDTEAPTNVSNFRAVFSGEHIRLFWNNPILDDFSHVRVLSSDYFYPGHIADGWLVYEGVLSGAVDERFLRESEKRYYTIFVYDTSGNISSGAVTSIVRGGVGSGGSSGDDSAGTNELGDREIGETSSTTVSEPTFVFDDIAFSQEGESRPSFGGEVRLDADMDTHISLPYELLPEHLKTLVVTLHHPTDSERVFSFLLRINQNKTSYEARIGPLVESGVYTVSVDLFDYKTQDIENVDGVAVVEKSTISRIVQSENYRSVSDFVKGFGLIIPLSLILLLLLLILLRFFVRKRSDDEDSTL